MFPTISKSYISNIITSIGHSLNGQAWSKTSESTSIINILEDDLRILTKDNDYNVKSKFEAVWFQN